jgi:hypothetical protein
MAANVRGGSMKTCFTLMFQILVYCSFQQHLKTVKATASLLGKDIEIFFSNEILQIFSNHSSAADKA